MVKKRGKNTIPGIITGGCKNIGPVLLYFFKCHLLQLGLYKNKKQLFWRAGEARSIGGWCDFTIGKFVSQQGLIISTTNWLSPWKPLGHVMQLTSFFFFSLICVRIFLFDCSLSALKFIYKPPNCLILRPVSMLLLVNFRLQEKWPLKNQVIKSKWKQLRLF